MFFGVFSLCFRLALTPVCYCFAVFGFVKKRKTAGGLAGFLGLFIFAAAFA